MTADYDGPTVADLEAEEREAEWQRFLASQLAALDRAAPHRD